MLSIDVLNDQELIHYLTKRDGKLDEYTYLITINRPDTQMIIPSKDMIYSDTFTYKSMNEKNCRNLIKFINKLVEKVVNDTNTGWDTYKLIIHSPLKRGVSRGIANYIFMIFPEEYINNLYYNTFQPNEESIIPLTAVYNKLYATFIYFRAFRLDF